MELKDAKALQPGSFIYHKNKEHADGSPMRRRVISIRVWKKEPERIKISVRHWGGVKIFDETEINQFVQL